jgi:hypothetical protein
MEQMGARNQQFPSDCWLTSEQLGALKKSGVVVVTWKLRLLPKLLTFASGFTSVISEVSVGSLSEPWGLKLSVETAPLGGRSG